MIGAGARILFIKKWGVVMRITVLAMVVSVCASAAHASTMIETTVFDRGENGYFAFRIPAIITAQNGDLLAFAEARRDNLQDEGDIDIVLKRSTDGGVSWGPMQLLADNGAGKAGNPTPVLDQTTGNIILPYSVDVETPYVITSSDHGLTWSAPVNIKSSANPSNWKGYVFGPTHGIQLQRGPHAGRLVIPGSHSLRGVPLEPMGREAHLIYSDDGGASWNVGGVLTNPTEGIGPGEATVTELVDGTLYVNTRNQGDFSRHRLIGYSEDGGLSFTNQAQIEYGLIDPKVQGSVVRYSAIDAGDDRNRILFSNPKSQDSRTDLHVRSSFDESTSWDEGKLINRERSAYSDLVKLQDGRIGVLYEWGNKKTYEEIRFTTFTEDWLDSPTALHYNFDAAYLTSANGTNLVTSIDGYNYDGYAVASMTQVSGSADYPGAGALRFTGANSNDTIRVLKAKESGNFEFAHEDSFTIEAVFRTEQHDTDRGIIFDKSGPNTKGAYSIGIENGKLLFYTRDLSGNQASLLSDTDINDGAWHHVAVVRDAAAQRFYLYIDHQLTDTFIDPTTHDFGAVIGNAMVPYIGSTASGQDQFDGDLQHLRISMAALTADLFLQRMLAGDLDGNGFVDKNDLDIVLGAWNQFVPPGNPLADPSGDGFVGLADLDTVLGNWNAGTTPGGTALPEPASLAVLSTGAVALLRWREGR